MSRGGSRTGLVYHAGGLGDWVLSLAAVHRVAAARPGLRWSFWGPADRRRLLPGAGPPPPALLSRGHTLWGDGPDPAVTESLAGFDVVLAFGGRHAPTWIRHVPGPVVSVRSFPPPGGPRVPAYQLRQLDRQGVPRFPGPWLPGWRRAVLPARVPERIVVHPGSGDPGKNLPADTWAAAVAALRRRTGLPAVAVLGPAEAERGGWDALVGVADPRVCSGVGDLLAVLAGAEVYLGNDAGPTHLAAALGVPTVAVFGPSDPALWRPLGRRVAVVGTARSCAPCTAGGPVACPASGCLAALSPATVAAAARAVLSGR